MGELKSSKKYLWISNQIDKLKRHPHKNNSDIVREMPFGLKDILFINKTVAKDIYKLFGLLDAVQIKA